MSSYMPRSLSCGLPWLHFWSWWLLCASEWGIVEIYHIFLFLWFRSWFPWLHVYMFHMSFSYHRHTWFKNKVLTCEAGPLVGAMWMSLPCATVTSNPNILICLTISPALSFLWCCLRKCGNMPSVYVFRRIRGSCHGKFFVLCNIMCVLWIIVKCIICEVFYFSDWPLKKSNMSYFYQFNC